MEEKDKPYTINHTTPQPLKLGSRTQRDLNGFLKHFRFESLQQAALWPKKDLEGLFTTASYNGVSVKVLLKVSVSAFKVSRTVVSGFYDV